MKSFEFLYESENGLVLSYTVSALSRYDAFNKVEKECPEAIDACLECSEV